MNDIKAVARTALSCLDLTSLNDGDTPEVIDALCDRALDNRLGVRPAAVCVYPKFVAQAVHRPQGSGIQGNPTVLSNVGGVRTKGLEAALSLRLMPGVMGAQASKTEESFEQGLLEYPHYTRPQTFENMEIPSVLTSGNHAEIQRWRRAESERLTRERRPDLWAPYEKRSRSARRPDLSATRPPDGGKK